ncbi:MAG: tetratricopeptide repeat protein [Alphaproteobacteria bacterium]|nr:tetratricopeptide repeat protein [Alphaproteobacteria bacterium]
MRVRLALALLLAALGAEPSFALDKKNVTGCEGVEVSPELRLSACQNILVAPWMREGTAAWAFAGLGIALIDLGDYPLAIVHFEESLHMRETYADALNGRGAAKLYMNDPTGAIPDFEAAIAKDKDNVLYFYNLAIARARGR